MAPGFVAEVRIRRYTDSSECDVVVVVREQKIVLKCRDYSQAVKWARIECRAYKIAHEFAVD
jgi:hypothetical protein